MIKQIIEKVKALPPGRLVLHLDADGWSLPPFCNTDDLHSLVEHIEKLEAKDQELRDVLNGWLGWFNGPYIEGVGYINPPLKRTNEALKESQP